MKYFRYMLFIVILSISIMVNGQTTQTEFHKEIQRIYDVDIRTLSKLELQSYMKEIDQLWEKVKDDQEKFVPLLKKELEDPTNPDFFYYDGHKLLLTVTDDDKDKIEFINYLSRADLSSLPKLNIMYYLQMLVYDGFDISKAALHFLDYPDFSVILLNHFLTLNQNYCFIYMAIPSDEKLMTDSLIARLSTEKNDKTIKTIILTLSYLINKQADDAIKDYSNNKKVNDELKEYCLAVLKAIDDINPAGGIKSFFSSVKSQKEKRRKLMMKSFSDETLDDFEEISDGIRALYKKE